MSTPPIGPNTPGNLRRLEQKVQSHAEILLTRHIPDLQYAQTKFPGGFDRAAFKASHTATTPQGRDPANSLLAAWDAAMNDLNEVLRNAYGLVHGYQKVGPQMPVVYREPALALSRSTQLQQINRARNSLTHDYPFASDDALFDAVDLFLKSVKVTLAEANALAHTYGVDIPAVP